MRLERSGTPRPRGTASAAITLFGMVPVLLMLGGCGGGGGSSSASTSTAPSSSPTPTPPATVALGPFDDASGQWSSVSLTTALQSNPFVSALGSNGRSCGTCHSPSDAWSATPASLQARFNTTNGADPIFNSVDGTNCGPAASSSLSDLQAASSELLNKGLIRIQLPIPAGAQFSATSVSNPYGCNSTTTLSLYRRILPSTNLSFLSTVMWDGRESFGKADLQSALISQASDAVLSHQQAASAPSSTVLQQIYAFEIALFSSQATDSAAGSLSAGGATGGAGSLSQQGFVAGSNDPFAATTSPQGIPPAPVFTVFQSWEGLTAVDTTSLAQESIGRGEKLFNTLQFSITLVGGLNDTADPAGNVRTVVTGTCGTCHNTPNAGGNSTNRLFNTGVAAPNSKNTDLPVITLTNLKTGAVIATTDPGYALTTGLWSDVGKFKVPTLRNLAARAPYFHNGNAPSLTAVVNFYNNRFNLNLTPQQQTDLVNFLKAL